MTKAQVTALDWSNSAKLVALAGELDWDRRRRIITLRQKVSGTQRLRDAFGRRRHAYGPRGSIYAMSDWDRADDFCNCGLRIQGQIRHCDLPKFCCSCSYRRIWGVLCRFAPHFEKGDWKFVTISFRDGIRAEDTLYSPLKDFWNVTRKTMVLLQERGFMMGAVWREELQVMSFDPLTYRPHLHAQCDAPGLTASAIESLMRGRFRSELDWLLAPLDVDCRSSRTPRAYQNRFSYMFKEIDLLTPYRAAARKYGPGTDFTRLNRRVNLFLRDFPQAMRHRKQSGYMGNMYPRSENYIGTQPEVFRPRPLESAFQRERRKGYNRFIARLIVT